MMKNLMNDIDNEFAESSLDDLQTMQKKLEKFVEKRLDSKKREALLQIQNIVRDNELSLDEVNASIRTTAKRGKAPPIFRHEDNWRITWSGKGEAPDWYKDHPNPESLRIKDE
jgi:DNA-binding protein H-NS